MATRDHLHCFLLFPLRMLRNGGNSICDSKSVCRKRIGVFNFTVESRRLTHLHSSTSPHSPPSKPPPSNLLSPFVPFPFLHFRYCKALLFLSLTHVSSAIASVLTYKLVKMLSVCVDVSQGGTNCRPNRCVRRHTNEPLSHIKN